MKITFVTTHMNQAAGAGLVIRNFANELIENGFDVCIIAQTFKKELWYFNPKIKLLEVGGPLPTSPMYWLTLKRDINKRYLQILSSIYSDIIIPQLFPVNYFCSNLDKKYYGKIVFYCHEPYRYFYDADYCSMAPFFERMVMKCIKILYKRLDLIGAQKSDQILCNSEFVKQKIKIYYNRDATVVYPYPKLNFNKIGESNLDLRTKLNLNINNPLIFTIGLSSHSKGVHEMMMIFHEVLISYPTVKLLIGGKISENNMQIIRKDLQKFAIPKDSIIFYGYIPENELSEMYRQSTLTYYTAIDESFGLVPVESMINGTPVIAFEGGPSETIQDGENGFVLPKRDIHGFKEKTLLLLNNPELREKFSKNAKNYCEKKCSFKATFDILLQNLLNS